jgi:transketolase
MEGISHEVCSLAGTLGLGKLIALYDDNGISIDGKVQGWFSEDVPKRFEAYGWQVIADVDGHDAGAIKAAIEQARQNSDQPSLISCKTQIGYGSPNKVGTHGVHGAPLGAEEIAATRAQLGWTHPPFEIPQSIYAGWDARAKGAGEEAAWQEQFELYRQAYPELAAEFERRMAGKFPSDWLDNYSAYIEQTAAAGESLATRSASQKALNALGPLLPEMLGGSADLTGSNNTNWKGSVTIGADQAGNYLHYGVREFGMGAIMNGVALHGGLIPYGGTFLVFSDYARNAIRMGALMRQRVIYVLTHDSIGLGEDGPTHQPVEHLASLRLIPNLALWRPCDAVETALAWQAALERQNGPTCLILSRQKLAHQSRTPAQLQAIRRGGYVLLDSHNPPEAILIATGSELALAMSAAQQLNEQGRNIRVVSMPSVDAFEAQDEAYRESVLPTAIQARVVVEAGVSAAWYKYAGSQGRVIGLDHFGASAPAGALFEHFGFTVADIVGTVEEILN